MSDLSRWAIPPQFTCDGCCCTVPGSISCGVGEPVETLPPGWFYRRSIDTYYACSLDCVRKINLLLEVKPC